MCVPLSGSQANGGLPLMARSIEPVSGKTGTMIQFLVTAKSWTMLGNGVSSISARVIAPFLSAVWMLTKGVKGPFAL